MERQALWSRLSDALSGLKTLLAAGLFVALGLAQELQAIDLRPFLTMLFGEELAGKLMITLPIVFVVLRVVSTGPVWFRKGKNEGF